MTQHQNTELPDEVYLDFKITPEGHIENVLFGNHKYVRPAKAVQGDKAEAVEAFETAYARFKSGYCDGQKKAEFANGRQILIMDHEAEAIRAALTPESEGIAGKGDEYKPRHAGAIDEMDDYVLDRIAALSTLSRPQEIDVEKDKK